MKYYQSPMTIQSLAPDIREQFEGWLSHREGRYVKLHDEKGKLIVSENFWIGKQNARYNDVAEVNANS